MMTSSPQKHSVQINHGWAGPPSLSPARHAPHAPAGSGLIPSSVGGRIRGLSVGVDLHGNRDHLREPTGGQRRKSAFFPQLPFYRGGKKNVLEICRSIYKPPLPSVSRGGDTDREGAFKMELWLHVRFTRSDAGPKLAVLTRRRPVSPTPAFRPQGAARQGAGVETRNRWLWPLLVVATGSGCLAAGASYSCSQLGVIRERPNPTVLPTEAGPSEAG